MILRSGTLFNRKKKLVKNKDDAEDPLVKLTREAKKASVVLLEIKTVFPFDFFTDTITIDINQVNIRRRIFFYSEEIISLPIKNIAEVTCDIALFFATLKISDQFFTNKTDIVRFLKKDEALRARRIIQGLIIAQKNEIDLSKVPVGEIRKKIEELGKISEDA